MLRTENGETLISKIRKNKTNKQNYKEHTKKGATK